MNGHARSGDRLLLRLGAVAAVIGTVLQVAAGSSQSALLGTSTELSLAALARLDDWVWPSVYLGFIFGALLWVGTLVALAATLTEGAAWALSRLALAAGIVGATLHAIDGSIQAGGLAGMARVWEAAAEGERAALEQTAEVLLRLLDGTWAGVITLFHGVPFVLAGLAVALSRRYPAWLGWAGVVGGAGSVIIGIGMYLRLAPAGLAVPFAVLLSLFMVILGWCMWTNSAAEADATGPHQSAEPDAGA